MFIWDGSQLDINNFLKIEEGSYNKTLYWRIYYNLNGIEKEELCIIKRPSKGSLLCLIDEIKPIFGLQKLGTHWIKFKAKELVLIKIDLDEDGSVKSYMTLKEFGYNEKLQNEVQKIFAFRDLLGMSKSFEGSIVLREVVNKNFKYIIPVSFSDPNMTPFGEKDIIPNTVIEKWFNGITIDEVVKKMLKADNLEGITEILATLRTKLRSVIERCNKEHIMFVNEILSRVGARLRYIL